MLISCRIGQPVAGVPGWRLSLSYFGVRTRASRRKCIAASLAKGLSRGFEKEGRGVDLAPDLVARAAIVAWSHPETSMTVHTWLRSKLGQKFPAVASRRWIGLPLAKTCSGMNGCRDSLYVAVGVTIFPIIHRENSLTTARAMGLCGIHQEGTLMFAPKSLAAVSDPHLR